jgi:hypothetical protein
MKAFVDLHLFYIVERNKIKLPSFRAGEGGNFANPQKRDGHCVPKDTYGNRLLDKLKMLYLHL